MYPRTVQAIGNENNQSMPIMPHASKGRSVNHWYVRICSTCLYLRNTNHCSRLHEPHSESHSAAQMPNMYTCSMTTSFGVTETEPLNFIKESSDVGRT